MACRGPRTEGVDGLAEGAASIEVVADAYEAPPMYKKLHENVKSFYNVQ
jgi:indolepyruvate decarboxylase